MYFDWFCYSKVDVDNARRSLCKVPIGGVFKPKTGDVREPPVQKESQAGAGALGLKRSDSFLEKNRSNH